MDELLKVALSEGIYHSSSEFTLDSLRSRAKLAEYQLPEPGLWLAKLVQAAHLARASQITIRFGHRRAEVQFDTRVPLRAQQLLEEVLSGRLYKDGINFHLITGIRSSATALSESLQWRVGGQGVRLHPEGVDVFGVSDPPDRFQLEVGLPSRSRGIWRTLASPVSHLARSTVEEINCLDGRCWYSSVPIKVDGRTLPRQLAQELFWYHQETVSSVLRRYSNHHKYYRCVLATRAFELEGRPDLACLPLPPAGKLCKRLGAVTYTYPSFLYGHYAVWDAPERFQAIVCLALQERSEVRVEFLLDGVRVDEVVIREGLHPAGLGRLVEHYVRAGLRLLVAVRPDEVDLSHFKVRDGENLARELLQRSLPVIKDTFATLSDNFRHLHYLPMSQSYAVPAGLVFLAGTGLAAAISLPAAAWVVGANAALGPANFAIIRGMIATALKPLRDAAEKNFSS